MTSFEIKCCGKKIKSGDVNFLKDLKNFTDRKIFYSVCPVCYDHVAVLFEKRISDGQVFIDYFRGFEALKLLHREKNRILKILSDLKARSLYGWIYGKNVQIRNKKGEVTQIRQYSSDFQGNSSLTKKIVVNPK